ARLFFQLKLDQAQLGIEHPHHVVAQATEHRRQMIKLCGRRQLCLLHARGRYGRTASLKFSHRSTLLSSSSSGLRVSRSGLKTGITRNPELVTRNCCYRREPRISSPSRKPAAAE